MPLNEYKFFEKTGKGNKPSNDTAEKSFKRWMDATYGEGTDTPPSDFERRKPVLEKLWKKAGSPYIDLQDDPTFRADYSQSSRFTLYDIFGMHEKARIENPDTMRIKANLDDFIAELSHGYQLKDKGFLESIPIKSRAIGERLIYGDSGRYDVDSSFEHHAHSKIEPSIWDEYYNSFEIYGPKIDTRKMKARDIFKLQKMGSIDTSGYKTR